MTTRTRIVRNALSLKSLCLVMFALLSSLSLTRESASQIDFLKKLFKPGNKLKFQLDRVASQRIKVLSYEYVGEAMVGGDIYEIVLLSQIHGEINLAFRAYDRNGTVVRSDGMLWIKDVVRGETYRERINVGKDGTTVNVYYKDRRSR